MKDKKLIISMEAFGEKHTIEMSDESNVANLARAFVNLMASTGYSREGVVELFKDGDPANWDDAYSIDK